MKSLLANGRVCRLEAVNCMLSAASSDSLSDKSGTGSGGGPGGFLATATDPVGGPGMLSGGGCGGSGVDVVGFFSNMPLLLWNGMQNHSICVIGIDIGIDIGIGIVISAGFKPT